MLSQVKLTACVSKKCLSFFSKLHVFFPLSFGIYLVLILLLL